MSKYEELDGMRQGMTDLLYAAYERGFKAGKRKGARVVDEALQKSYKDGYENGFNDGKIDISDAGNSADDEIFETGDEVIYDDDIKAVVLDMTGKDSYMIYDENGVVSKKYGCDIVRTGRKITQALELVEILRNTLA